MSRRRFWFVAALLLLLLAMTVAVLIRALIAYYEYSSAVTTMEKNGAAVSKPMPNVTVLVPETGGGEKKFGDQQLLAILPALPHVDRFDSLDLHGSSVTDAGIARLTKLAQLSSLDVSYTPVTVNGLLALQGMPSLQRIIIAPDQFSTQDLERLNAARLIWFKFSRWRPGVPKTLGAGT